MSSPRGLGDRSRASTRALGAQEPQGRTDDGQGCAALSLTRMAAAGAPELDYRPPATDPKVCISTSVH